MESKNSLPPLFDDKSDEEVASEGMEQAELVQRINQLRMMQIEGGGDGPDGGLSDDQVREGIRLNVELRKIRAGGKKAESELPPVLEEKLGDFF